MCWSYALSLLLQTQSQQHVQLHFSSCIHYFVTVPGGWYSRAGNSPCSRRTCMLLTTYDRLIFAWNAHLANNINFDLLMLWAQKHRASYHLLWYQTKRRWLLERAVKRATQTTSNWVALNSQIWQTRYLWPSVLVQSLSLGLARTSLTWAPVQALAMQVVSWKGRWGWEIYYVT